LFYFDGSEQMNIHLSKKLLI